MQCTEVIQQQQELNSEARQLIRDNRDAILAKITRQMLGDLLDEVENVGLVQANKKSPMANKKSSTLFSCLNYQKNFFCLDTL